MEPFAGLLVQVPGRLVRQQRPGRLGQRPRHGHALLLPSGQGAGTMGGALAEPQLGEELLGPAPHLGLGLAGDQTGHHHVLEGRELGQQVMELKHEAEGAVAELPEPRLGEREGVLPCDVDASALGPIERPQHMKQRRLADAGGPGDRQHFPGRHRQIQPLQHGHIPRRRPVPLHDVGGDNQRLRHS
jgi:hypothetical protein